MSTSSLVSIARLLNTNSLKGMAAILGLQSPLSARDIIRKASFIFLTQWELVTSSGIARNNNVWHAGRANDILLLDSKRLLLASATGGVWLASPDGHSDPMSLSNSWPRVDMHCLCAGPKGPNHIYAAGAEGALFETEVESLRSAAHFMKSNSVGEMAAKLDLETPISLREVIRRSGAALFDWKEIKLNAPPSWSTSTGLLGVTMFGGKGITFGSSAPTIGPRKIYQLLVVSGIRPAKIVLATDRGLYWSDIPALGHEYLFIPAVGAPRTLSLGVALAANNTVVASPRGNVTTPQSNGMYFGTWEADNLLMRRAEHLGDIDFVRWNDAVMAASTANRSILYAAVSSSGKTTISLKHAFAKASLSGLSMSVGRLAQRVGVNPPILIAALIKRVDPPVVPARDLIYAVLLSENGGATWQPTGPNRKVEESVRFPIPRDPGHTQDGYNMSIAVSHANSDIVALGFQSGPWIGRNTPTAFLWEEHGENLSDHVHPDIHSIQFDAHDPQANTLYACSDGGIVFTRDLCTTFDSTINKALPNLQFYASGASFNTPGLLAGPLQDNGIVFSFRKDGIQGPWQQIDEGDGIIAIFLKGDLLLFWNNDEGGDRQPPARVKKWKGVEFDPPGGNRGIDVAVRRPSPTVPAGTTFVGPLVEPVMRPMYQRLDTNQSMLAVAAYNLGTPFKDLWGLFADPDGSNPNPGWEYLATISLGPGDSITGVSSDDGFTVLAGTAKGKIYFVDARSNRVSEMQFDPMIEVPKEQIDQFSFLADGAVIARYEGSSLLRFDQAQNRWTEMVGNGLPSDQGWFSYMAVDSVRKPNVLYMATDYGVHASWDAGTNWLPVSQGLPLRSHPKTLRFVVEPSGDRLLYLFTYGRSAWRAHLN